MDDATRKALLRESARAARQGILAEERPVLARAAADRALELPEVHRATYVLGFAAAPEELDPDPLLEALRSLGATVCLPRITGPGALSIHVYAPGEPLESGPFGLRQPAADATATDLDAIDLVVAPGVAFDARGARLGFGGGHYDRLFVRVPLAARVALAFDAQVVAEVPESEHDQRVDVVITPTRTLRGSPRASARSVPRDHA